jgi:hypothetical protein
MSTWFLGSFQTEFLQTGVCMYKTTLVLYQTSRARGNLPYCQGGQVLHFFAALISEAGAGTSAEAFCFFNPLLKEQGVTTKNN